MAEQYGGPRVAIGQRGSHLCLFVLLLHLFACSYFRLHIRPDPGTPASVPRPRRPLANTRVGP
eukprot:26557-Rhodomonas_salina.3